MQKDSMHFSTTDHMTYNQAVPQESLIKSFQCSHCTLIFKSKVFLFEHLKKEHGFDVDVALRDAGFKNPGTNKASTDNSSNSSGNNSECQHCDFKTCSWDVLNEHEKQCQIKSEDRKVIGNLIISENPKTDIHLTNQHKEAAGAKEISSVILVMPTSKSHLNSSKDLKTYKRPLQTITKDFEASSGSNGKPPVKLDDIPELLDSTKGTLFLQESPPDSSPNSSGVFKVTAKPIIDVPKTANHCFLLHDHLRSSVLRPPMPEEQFREKVPDNVGKRSNNESSKSPPAKKAKHDKEETELQEKANTSTQQPSCNTEFSFEFSEDEDEKNLVNGDTESQKVYFCKHCDYSNANIKRVSTHYQNDHPYIRYNAVYIQDPSDQSATFRCLECPVEFLSVVDLKRHYTENHPEGPNLFTMHPRELHLVFKCFVCSFTTNALKELNKHYKEMHPTHEEDNSLMYCRYSVTRCEEGPSQLNKCEKAPSPERPQEVSHDSDHTSCKEVKNAPSPQHPTSKRADVAIYHCNNCNFNHKSVVAMHVHYQKSHPDEAVTIDKIKQSSCVMSDTTLQMTPDESPKSVTTKEKSTPQKNISDCFKETRNKAELSQQKNISLSLANPKHTPEASKTHSECAKTKKVKSTEDRSKGKKSLTKCNREMSAGMDSLSSSSPNELFYCRFCSYSSPNIKSIVCHHYAKHAAVAPINTEEILWYSSEVQKKKLQIEAEASDRTTSSDSKNGKQVDVYSKNERQHEECEATDALMTEYNPYACPEKLFYCQNCNYGNTSAQGVVNHQAKVHHSVKTSLEHVIEYTALIRDEIEKSKSQANDSSFSSHLPLPLMHEGEEDVFFCHFCNYRNGTVNHVLRHYFKTHRGFVVTGDQVQRYSSMVLKQTKKSHLKTTAGQEVNQSFFGKKRITKKKTMKLGKVSASPLQTQRILQCHRCSYSTQFVYLLRRHMWKTHKSNRSSPELLRLCFKQGTLETGYHCDFCVFSHIKAAAVYKHYQEKHPERKLSLEYVTTRLYVGPETCPPKKKKPQSKQPDGFSDGTDGSLPSQRSEQSETKMYSCRACSYKGISMSSIARHYRVVHPWSVKEDGSVLYLINNKKRSANKQVEDQNEMPLSFDTYQAPLEFEKSPGSSHQAVSSEKIKCPFCPAMFPTQRGLNTHCDIKHQEGAMENLDRQKEEQVQTQTHMHVFKCPHCTYVNTNYQGVLTHCQMRHPALASRADSLFVDEAHLHNWEDCVKKQGPGLRLCGYMCKTCPQIYATLEKLSKHCEEGHNETVASTVPKESKSAPKLSAVTKKKLYKINSNQGSVSKASFFNKKIYAMIRCQYCSYGCTTKLALGRHLQVRHKIASVSKVQDCLYKCALCSNFYFKKKRLGSHYVKKHGKEAFLKYYAPLYKEVHEIPPPTVPDSPLTQHNTSKACKSSTTAEENKKIVYKCPSCPYVNASFHGTLTHCQMRHPDLTVRANELQTDEILVAHMVGCTLGKGSNLRGYECKNCPQVHVSLKKLKIHCERDHNLSEATASKLEKQPEHGSRGLVLEAFSLKNKTSAVSTSEIGLSHQLGTPETFQSNSSLVQDKKSLYKCRICSYIGSCRKYLYCHYKKTHKFDAFTTYKLLEKYNKRKGPKPRNVPEAESKESAHLKCKMCPNLKFDSSQQLISHYSTFHLSDCILDFIVLTQASKKSTGLYKCSLCKKQMNGIRKLCHHLDRHRESEKKNAKAAKTKASDVIMMTPQTRSIALCRQDELPMLETVEDLAQWNVTPIETFTVPPSPPSSPSKPTDLEQPELESKEDKLTCKQCGRKFMSLKGLRSHERSHAALAAIKKQNTLSTSTLKHDINKYVLFKAGNLRPFRCSFCSYRTTVLGLWRRHFMKKHQHVVKDPAETDNQDEESNQRADEERSNSTEELNNLSEFDNEPEMTEELLYLEPPDVQRQLNHYSLMAQASAISKENMEEAKLSENRLLHCEVCSFNTGHLSSMRRHYLNRHGKKMLRCKDCSFFTGLRKTLEMHIKTGHSTCQSEPTHQKDLRCPFCLYQTKNKNNMIDHIVLHREERVVPIEVRRQKLSRYLQGIVFRCHKCTFTSGSAENLHFHMMKHDDIKPYKCRLCYFDCTRLSDLEAHLSDKHQVMRNHELVGQINLDQLGARVGRMPEEEVEPVSDMERHNDGDVVKTEEFVIDCNEVSHETQAKNPAENNTRENTLQIKEAYQNQNTTVQEKQEQNPQEQAETAFLSDTGRGHRIEHTLEQKDKEAEGSSTTSGKVAEEAQAHKLHITALKHRTLNIEARIEDDISRHVLRLDEDGSTCKMHKKSDMDITVKTEQNIEPEVAETNHMPANKIRAQEHFTVERHLLTILPNCGQHNLSLKGILFTNCKEKQMQTQDNGKEVSDPYGEMPALEKECLKEEMHPLSFCKEEDQNDHFEREKDKEDEMTPEDDKSHLEHWEGNGIKEAENPHVPKGAFTVADGETTDDKLFTCEFCGRNLMNSSELERHIIRHGI